MDLFAKRELAARDVLHELGVTRNYDGFPCVAAATALIMEDESYLRRITKNLYPELGKRFDTSAHSLQRNFRTIIDVCFRDENKPKLEKIAGRELSDKPTITEFLDILVTHLLRQEENSRQD